MQVIMKYKAKDGTEFDTEGKCISYESLCEEVAGIMAALQGRPEDDGCSFANGEGYIQHDVAKVEAVRVSILKIGLRFVQYPPWLQKTIDNPADTQPSWAGRLISERCPKPVYEAWHRFMCMDTQNREWGQPYYAANPDKASGQFEIKAS